MANKTKSNFPGLAKISHKVNSTRDIPKHKAKLWDKKFKRAKEDPDFDPQAELYSARCSHAGKPILFQDPRALLFAATQYFDWSNTHPLFTIDFKNSKDGLKKIKIPVRRPYTYSGLCIYLGTSSKYFDVFRLQCREKKHDAYITIMNLIDEIIYTQKFEGAAVGHFNSNIIAMELGLSRRIENVELSKQQKPLLELKVYNTAPPLASDEKDIQ